MSHALAARLFADEDDIRNIGEGLLARALTRDEWTHEAHLAACLWILVERPDILPERNLPGIIRRFNESVGGINDETQGYHETITQCFILGVRLALARMPADARLDEKVNALLTAPEGKRDWPLRFYSRARLFSIEARLGFVAPDLQPLPASITGPERCRG
jgi:hypothetical protein